MKLVLFSPSQRCAKFFIFCCLCKHFCPPLIAFLTEVLTLKAGLCKQVSSIQNKWQNPLTVCSPQVCKALGTVFKYIFTTIILAEGSMYKKVGKIRLLPSHKHKETGLTPCKDIHMTVMWSLMLSYTVGYFLAGTHTVVLSFSYVVAALPGKMPGTIFSRRNLRSFVYTVSFSLLHISCGRLLYVIVHLLLFA